MACRGEADAAGEQGPEDSGAPAAPVDAHLAAGGSGAGRRGRSSSELSRGAPQPRDPVSPGVSPRPGNGPDAGHALPPTDSARVCGVLALRSGSRRGQKLPETTAAPVPAPTPAPHSGATARPVSRTAAPRRRRSRADSGWAAGPARSRVPRVRAELTCREQAPGAGRHLEPAAGRWPESSRVFLEEA